MRYVIVSVTKGNAGEFNNKLRKNLFEKFGAKSSKLPPHFTIKSPFESKDLSSLENMLKKFCDSNPISSYKIDGYDHFDDRVVYMKKDGEDISMDKIYTIVLNNYRASNTSIYPAYKGCKVVKEINLDMSEIILDYIQKHKKIVVDEKQNYFIN